MMIGIMQRVFVVGFPRSGTTIVQAWLARHLDVFTLPETSFFEHACGNLAFRWGDRDARDEDRLWHRLGAIHGAARRTYAQVAESLGEQPRRLPSNRTRAARAFVELIDRAAERHGASGWIEKTPNHVYFIDEIEQLVPGVTFVHVVRRGEDALASIVDAQIGYDSFHGSIGDWARRWNAAMRVHARCAGRANHTIVSYESFASSARERSRVMRFLGLPPRSPGRSAEVEVADAERHPWIAAAATGLIRPAERKRDAIFGPKIATWLAANLTDFVPPHGLTRLGGTDLLGPAPLQAPASRAASTGS
jgi:hypothetical protein